MSDSIGNGDEFRERQNEKKKNGATATEKKGTRDGRAHGTDTTL